MTATHSSRMLILGSGPAGLAAAIYGARAGLAPIVVKRLVPVIERVASTGVGVPPEIPTWGTMLADARIYISTAWWLPLFPGLCIFITVLGINLLGDAMRDILDPRLKRTGTGL